MHSPTSRVTGFRNPCLSNPPGWKTEIDQRSARPRWRCLPLIDFPQRKDSRRRQLHWRQHFQLSHSRRRLTLLSRQCDPAHRQQAINNCGVGCLGEKKCTSKCMMKTEQATFDDRHIRGAVDDNQLKSDLFLCTQIQFRHHLVTNQ